MPSIPIVDSHVHLWDPHRFRMPWLDGDELLCRPFGVEEFAAASKGLPVEGYLYVQVDVTPAYGLLEAQWAVARVAEDPRLLGIVAWAPLEDGEVARSYLDALVRVDPRIKGVRRLIQSETDPEFPIRPDFLRALRMLPEYRLTFDICIRHHQLANTVQMVRACPDTSFVLDHLGKPNVRDGELDPWREQIAELASFPNVACKLSGLVTEANHQRWSPAEFHPYVAHVLEVFGEDRVLFGSDWPVVTHAASYRGWVDALDRLVTSQSPEAQRKLFAENARRFYGL